MKYLVRRLLLALLVIWGVATLVFFILHLTPGDPVEVMLGEQASVADKESLRQALHLDLPVVEQYGLYLSGLLQGDLGLSLHRRLPVIEILMERLPATVLLAVMAMLFALLIALPLGIYSALKRNTWVDRWIGVGSLLSMATPNFVLGPLLILLFSVTLIWLPTGGFYSWDSVILPAIALGSGMAAVLVRMLRASLIEVMDAQFLLTARAKGLSERRVIWVHLLGNAWLPVLTVLGLQLGTLLGGAVITEVVFSWPGIGSLLVEAIQQRDYPLVQGCILIVALAYVGVNLLTDLLYAWVDPRVRLGE
jgi:peptide/nickel transport system permease protein